MRTHTDEGRPARGELRITLLRTSCLLLETAAGRLLTDPFFHPSMRGLPIFRRPGIALGDLPPIDVVFASHLHRDHFDVDAVAAMTHPESVVVGTRGTQAHCRQTLARRRAAAGAIRLPPVHDLWHGERHSHAGFVMHGTPAEHTGPPPDEINAVIEAAGWRVFFGGDARWSDAYRWVEQRHGAMDIALLPIGGTLIFGHRTTMNPADAVRAAAALRARWVVPIHEGGEWLPVPPASWHPGRFRHFASALRRHVPASTREPVVLGPGVTAIFGRRADGPELAWWHALAPIAPTASRATGSPRS